MIMTQISPDTLMPLEVYAKARPEFRAKVIAHKQNRKMQLGENITLIFEDELTIRYQVQEDAARGADIRGRRHSRRARVPTIRWCPTAVTGRPP